MKKITLIALAMSFTIAEAGTTCSTDALGNYNCTNYATGYKSTTITDAFGNQQYRDNQGYTANCHVDASGDYSCI
jgi:hypothetical protein